MDPKILYRRLENIFQLLCFLLAIYMSVLLVGRFIQDKSTTSITYRRYSERAEDIYPTYSVCFKGTRFYWRHEFAIFNEYELYSYQWEHLLKGEPTFTYNYDLTSRLYKKQPATITHESKFDALHVQVRDVLVQANFTITDLKYSSVLVYDNHTFSRLSEYQPFKIGYQTPEMICFTRDSNSSAIRVEDVLVLIETLQYDAALFPGKNATYSNTFIQIHIHYPGQFIRSLDTPSFISSFVDFQWDKNLEFKLSQGTILRNRPESAAPCTHEIDDYDSYFQRIVCQKNDTFCIPPFWKKKLQGVLEMKGCTRQTQLKGIYGYIQNYDALLANYTAPCINMYNAVAWKWNARQDKSSSNNTLIKFLYQDKYYEEIQYTKAFDVEGFISNLGGFVGIFLGYSLMQLPGILGRYHCIILIYFIITINFILYINFLF